MSRQRGGGAKKAERLPGGAVEAKVSEQMPFCRPVGFLSRRVERYVDKKLHQGGSLEVRDEIRRALRPRTGDGDFSSQMRPLPLASARVQCGGRGVIGLWGKVRERQG